MAPHISQRHLRNDAAELPLSIYTSIKCGVRSSVASTLANTWQLKEKTFQETKCFLFLYPI